jgi:hypothetical protein
VIERLILSTASQPIENAETRRCQLLARRLASIAPLHFGQSAFDRREAPFGVRFAYGGATFRFGCECPD